MPQTLGALGPSSLRGSWAERDFGGQVFPKGTSVGCGNQEDVVWNHVWISGSFVDVACWSVNLHKVWNSINMKWIFEVFQYALLCKIPWHILCWERWKKPELRNLLICKALLYFPLCLVHFHLLSCLIAQQYKPYSRECCNEAPTRRKT